MKKAILTAVMLVAQCAAIGWLIWRYERVVSEGTEVRFACTAYDPSDPLRGRYLQTRVEATCTNILTETASARIDDLPFRSDFFAKLEPTGSNGLWRVAAVAAEPRDDGLWVKPENSWIEYRLQWSDRAKTGEELEDFIKRRAASGLKAVVRFPDRLFVNEKLAPEAEKILWSRGNQSAVAVYRALDGEMILTDIEVEGESIIKRLALAGARQDEGKEEDGQ